MRQILAEIGFKLLHAIDQRQDHITGALQPEMRRSQLDHLGVELFTQVQLHDGGGLVRDHVAPVFQHPAQRHDRGHDDERFNQRFGRFAPENLRQQPAQERQPRHPDGGGQQPHENRPEYPAPDPLRENP